LFIFLDVHRPWRKVKVTDRRAAEDSPPVCAILTDLHYPEAERIRVVLDNLSTHTASALVPDLPRRRSQTGATPARVPLHSKACSWLNMVEIEIGVLRGQCLDRRIPPGATRIRNRSLGKTANASGDRIKCMFTTEKARTKMGHAYPEITGAKIPSINESYITVQRY